MEQSKPVADWSWDELKAVREQHLSRDNTNLPEGVGFTFMEYAIQFGLKYEQAKKEVAMLRKAGCIVAIGYRPEARNDGRGGGRSVRVFQMVKVTC